MRVVHGAGKFRISGDPARQSDKFLGIADDPERCAEAGQVIEIDFQCLHSTTGSPTFGMAVFFGGIQIANSTRQIMPPSAK